MNPVVFRITCRLLIIFDNDEGKSDKRNDGRRRTDRNEGKRRRLHPLPRIRGREGEREREQPRIQITRPCSFLVLLSSFMIHEFFLQR